MIQGGEERFLYAAGAEAEADSDSDVSLHSGGDSVPQRRDFSTGLCACFEDMDSCCMTFWCPCVQQARNQHGVQGLRGRNDFVCISPLVASLLCGSCVGGCLSAYFEFNQRRALRQYHGYDQEETQCRDALIAGCCGACSTCQLAREIKNTRMLETGFRPTAAARENEFFHSGPVIVVQMQQPQQPSQPPQQGFLPPPYGHVQAEGGFGAHGGPLQQSPYLAYPPPPPAGPHEKQQHQDQLQRHQHQTPPYNPQATYANLSAMHTPAFFPQQQQHQQQHQHQHHQQQQEEEWGFPYPQVGQPQRRDREGFL